MKTRGAIAGLGVLVLAGCGGAQATSTTVTVSAPTTIRATVTSTVTYDPSAAAASSSAASASSVAAAGGAEFQAQMDAAGLIYPPLATAKGYCSNMDAGKEPIHGYIGDTLDDTLIVSTPNDLKALQITIATLCPQHQADLDAAQQKRQQGLDEAGAQAQVTYSVTSTGSGSASITYTEDDKFNLAQETNATLPWTKDVKIYGGSGRVLSLTAQNQGGGDISCSIAIAGQVVDTATSSGDYAIVTCSA